MPVSVVQLQVKDQCDRHGSISVLRKKKLEVIIIID